MFIGQIALFYLKQEAVALQGFFFVLFFVF